jgi:hemoglobin
LFAALTVHGEEKMSLYEKLGGAPAIEVAVDNFYNRVLADDRVAEFFDGVDMKRQIGKQRAFLAMVTGGPLKYTGLTMKKGHAELVKRGLNDSHVDAIIELLGATLLEMGANEADVREVASIAEGARDDVLGRSAS